LKCHYLAAFTAAILNNQPMGFYQPFTLVKDAQRHGLKVRAVDVTRSDWLCTIEAEESPKSQTRAEQSLDIEHGTWDKLVLRLGLKYVKGLREESGQAIVKARSAAPFLSIDDLQQRVPELRKDEMRKLAAVGALNFIQSKTGIPACQPLRRSLRMAESVPEECGYPEFPKEDRREFPKEDRQECLSYMNRRDALWQVERVVRPAGELYETLHELAGNSPLTPMTRPERMDADFRGTGLTIGRHPVAYQRAELDQLGVCRAVDMQHLRNGNAISVAGWVIVRQRPGTAKGFVFLTLEDETGVANVIITPPLFDKYRLVVVDHPFLLITGKLQNQDNVISVKAQHIRALSFKVAAAASHDFR
jgi:error-prone DNA polymerase